MQISFYKETYRLNPGDKERHATAPDTYYDISNITVYSDGMVAFSHMRNGKLEYIACNLKYKIIATEDEIQLVLRRSL
jgi:hypothetical protein